MKKYLLVVLVIAFSFTANAQLTGMNPNTAAPGSTLTTTITGPGIFIQGSSPSGNVFSVILTNGPTTITLFDWGNFIFNNLTVLSTDSILSDNFMIPMTATPGQYLLTVVTGDVFNPWNNQQTFTLPNAFTVTPPDGFVNGIVYDDANQNGVQDGGELGIQNQGIWILPENYYQVTDASGNYSIPVMNGNHTIQWNLISAFDNLQLSSDSATYAVQVNNNTQGGFDFGLKPALLSMAINYAEIGQTISTIITSDGAFNSIPSYIYISKSGYYVSATNISLIDSNHVSCSFSIPFSAGYIGSYYVFVSLGTQYALISAFTVTPFNAGITGMVYYDTNGNGVYDAGELPLSNSKIELLPNNTFALTDASGVYGIGTTNGNYTVQYIPRNYETITSVSSYNVAVNNNVISNQNFGVQISPTFDSLSLAVWHYRLRCNALQSVYVDVKNCGGSAANVKLFFIKDPSMTNTTMVPPPNYINGDSVVWFFPNLPVGKDTLFYPTFINPPAGTPYFLNISAKQYDAGNNLLFSETQYFSDIVSCSYDPNEKVVQPPGVQSQHYTLFNDDLYFTVHFQNTGNDTAFRVIVYDTLDADLDYNTFEFISSSHQVKTELNPANGAVKFTFNNILLPDSNINEPKSHGEVTYRIHTKPGLPANTVVNNTAYIVFDLNAAIITNSSMNTMVYVIPVGLDELKNTGNGVVIYPNPFDHTAWIIFDNSKNEKFELAITDPNGSKVLEKEISSDRYLLEKGNLSEGMYFYKLSNKDRSVIFSGKIAVR